MATSLLQTKLYILPPRSELVSRPRLIERLNIGLDRKLTLLSAPDGFGKTTPLPFGIEGLLVEQAFCRAHSLSLSSTTLRRNRVFCDQLSSILEISPISFAGWPTTLKEEKTR